jgi:YegS/Rv2252/BmrU family lipid kinase
LKKRILFIINPNAGHKRGAKLIDLLPKYLDGAKFDYSYQLTTHAKHAIALSAMAVVEGVDIVVAVGGDGMVNEVFQSLVHSAVAFSIIPMGSGNGVARSLGISMNIAQALTNLNKGQYNKMDTVSFNDQPYLGVAGVGFDGLIAWEFSKTKKRGMMSYLKIIFKQMAAFRSSEYVISTGEEQYDIDAFVIAIANTVQYGNDAFIAPEAELSNGQLDLVAIKKHSKWLLPILAMQVMTRNIHKSRHVETIRSSQFEIRTPYDKAHIDGEPMLLKDSVRVVVLPSSLIIYS